MSEVTITTQLPLLDGKQIPAYGFGVWDSPQNLTTKSCLEAFDAGYIHIDTAQGYSNEAEVGAALAKSGRSRSEIFITSKIFKAGSDPESTYQKLAESVKKIGGDSSDAYIDLMLIHNAAAGGVEVKLMWQSMERCLKEGKFKSIGVSNFGIGHLESMKEYATIWPPVVNQLELHPWCQQREVVDWCHRNKVVVEAYCPLVRNQKAGDATLKAIAEKHSKSTPQVLLRYCLQKDWVPLPKSDNPQRIRQNADVFDFALDDEDMRELDERPQEDALVVAVDNQAKL